MKGQLMLEEKITTLKNSLPTTATAVPAPQPAIYPWAWLTVLAAAVSSGLALTACFFPLSWGALSWVALVPLLILVRTRAHLPRPASWEPGQAATQPRKALARVARRLLSPLFSTGLWVDFCAWVSGSVFSWIVLSWMPASNEMMTNAWYIVSVYCSLYFPIAIVLTRLVERRNRLPLYLVFPVVWVGLDFVRSILATGFPWYYLGHTQHIFLPVIQIADLGGAYLVTFLVVMVNAQVFEWLCLSARVRNLFAIPEAPPEVAYRLLSICLRRSAVVAVAVLVALGYGAWRLNEGGMEEGPRVALLQGNLDQNVRNGATGEQQQGVAGNSRAAIMVEYKPLYEHIRSADPAPDLVVWPETSYHDWWIETDQSIPFQQVPRDWENFHNQARSTRSGMPAMALCCKMNLLIGINTDYLRPVDDKLKTVQYNSALLVRDSGLIGGRYDKIHRIPLGEYMPPLEKTLPFLKIFSPYDSLEYGIQAGKELKRFSLSDKYTFGVLICYEDSDPVLARQYGAAHTEDFPWNPLAWLERLRWHLDGVEVDEGRPVDFLVNMSNDGWYAGTSEHNEHLAIARFRAVETRRSLVRAVNMGISAVIDSNGTVLTPRRYGYTERKKGRDYIHYWHVAPGEQENLPVADWNEYKKVTGVLTASVPIDHRVSLYAQCGDWLPYGCWVIVGAGLVGLFRGRKKEPYKVAKIPQRTGPKP